MEIGRALLKCESEMAGTHNWRLVSLIHSQFEVLPKYFPSDFIYSYFVPMAFFRILHAVSFEYKFVYIIISFFAIIYNKIFLLLSEANTYSSLIGKSISYIFTL